MAKKKKIKTRSHKAATSARRQNTLAHPEAEPALPLGATATVRQSVLATEVGRWDYVASDILRIGILISVCIVIEALLAYALDHTSLGQSVFSLVKL